MIDKQFCFYDVIQSIDVISTDEDALNKFVQQRIFIEFSDQVLFTTNTKYNDVTINVFREYNRDVFELLANGNITSYRKAAQVIADTGAAGVMIGRSAIRNPWIFQQIRDYFAGKAITIVTLADVYGYIQHLHGITERDSLRDKSHINSLKKFLNFIGTGIDPEGNFLREMRLVQSKQALFELCDRHLLSNPDQPFAIEPYENLVARPSCETN